MYNYGFQPNNANNFGVQGQYLPSALVLRICENISIDVIHSLSLSNSYRGHLLTHSPYLVFQWCWRWTGTYSMDSNGLLDGVTVSSGWHSWLTSDIASHSLHYLLSVVVIPVFNALPLQPPFRTMSQLNPCSATFPVRFWLLVQQRFLSTASLLVVKKTHTIKYIFFQSTQQLVGDSSLSLLPILTYRQVRWLEPQAPHWPPFLTAPHHWLRRLLCKWWQLVS